MFKAWDDEKRGIIFLKKVTNNQFLFGFEWYQLLDIMFNDTQFIMEFYLPF